MKDVLCFLGAAATTMVLILIFVWFIQDDKRKDKFDSLMDKIFVLGFYSAKILLFILVCFVIVAAICVFIF